MNVHEVLKTVAEVNELEELFNEECKCDSPHVLSVCTILAVAHDKYACGPTYNICQGVIDWRKSDAENPLWQCRLCDQLVSLDHFNTVPI